MAEGTRNKLFASSNRQHYPISAEASCTVLVRHTPYTLKEILKKSGFPFVYVHSYFQLSVLSLFPQI